jgi:hypothetical protein
MTAVIRRPNKITGANAGGPRRLAIRRRWAARILSSVIGRLMSTCRCIWAIAALVLLACGCQLSNGNTQSSEAHPSSVPADFAWRIPPDFPTFGSPNPGFIRVAVSGYSVRPGYYYLPEGATVHDAMDAAHFSHFVGWQRPYCGIQRRRPDGSVETIWFTREGRAADEKRVLQNDDGLRISHEVY